ncbi:MAG: DUF1997 domain-containing protein [Leptolyngbya sp. SIO1E4]|nr:DUF1997 domain-containing protein [Leptolyngbya sp. SIO1E4]
MQTPFTNRQANDLPEQVLGTVSGLIDTSDEKSLPEQVATPRVNSPFLFQGEYAGRMEMSADCQTVARYLDDHRAWFLRCAHPMTADPLGDNGYALTVGHFGALGYDVEPQIGLHLLPQDKGVYRIETLPVPGYVPQGYDVDFKAALALNECSNDQHEVPLTQVDWELHLRVWVYFPRFIKALPKQIIQKTGDHLLSQIVRQVSRCLTHKVQEDFHQSLGLPFPESYGKRSHHFLERFSKRSDV